MTTKRHVWAHILVCNGCCCGKVEKGNPAVPVDWLKQQFKERKLTKKVHLTIAGCLGPCDVYNVVTVISDHGQTWLGQISEQWQYESLMDWASECATAEACLPLPLWTRRHEFYPFREVGLARVGASERVA
ncbi:MAG: (2Fe-2S) ferredoxin domain-containing protein [Bryobacter sp.]|nr:(2Fe-2S) ferredoxin domain-containing protein [Bryobacter sp.]